MEHNAINIAVPFESLAFSIAQLDLKDKMKILQLLDEQIAQAEEEAYDKDPQIRAEIREAREAYRTGDFEAIDEYVRKLPR